MKQEDKKKIYFFLKYDFISASTRQRFLSYFKYKPKNINIETNILFDNQYFSKKILNKNIPIIKIFFSYLNRIYKLLILPKKSKIIIQSELLPYFPNLIEKILVYKKIKYIIDLDDAFFHRYDQSNNFLINFFLKKKYHYIFKNAFLSILGSKYLNKKAREFGAKKTIIIPTGIIYNDYKKFNKIKKNKVFTIVWIGSPSTTKYLINIFPALEALNKKIKFVLRLIGSQSIETSYLPIESFPWSKDTENILLSQSHVGIMPLNNTFWEQGKCAFKLIQYMGAGLPVIGSAVGENISVISHKKNGFLAYNNSDWFNYLYYLYKNLKVRKNFGKYSKDVVIKKYSIENMQKVFWKNINLL